MAAIVTRQHRRQTFRKPPLNVEAELVKAFSVLTPAETSQLRSHLRQNSPLLFGAYARAFRRRGRG